MSKLLEVLDVKQSGNTLTIKIKNRSPSETGQINEISPEIVLCGLVKFQIRNLQLTSLKCKCIYSMLLSQRGLVKVAKVFKSDNFIYSIRLKLQELEESDISVGDTDNLDDATWQIFYDGGGDGKTNIGHISEYNLIISLIGTCKIFNGFPSLYDDTDLSDFKLLGKDGSISVHKLVLAQFSPVMKTMFIGQWKEVKDEAVEIPDTSKETLQQLKDFMYLQKMPENGIEKLAKLASCYMMSDLVEVCTYKLLTSLNSENVITTLKLAVNCNMERLMIAVMAITNNSMKVEDIIRKFESKIEVLESNQESESKA